MTITVGELAVRLQSDLMRGDVAQIVSGVQNLADAGAGELAPFTDALYLPQLKATRAGAVLLKRGISLDSVPPAAAILSCADPEIAFLEAVRLFNPEPARALGIHSTAIIDPSVEIGADVHVGPHVCIEAGARIGARCTIKANAVIGSGCVIGDDCTLHANVTLYRRVKLGHRVEVHSGVVLGADGFGYKFRGGKYIKVPHVGTVEIGDDVEIGANSCIDRGALGPTRIGAGTKIDNLVQIGHNNDFGRHCIVCGQAAVAGSCKVDDYAVLGGNVGVADHCHIGKGARIAAMSGVIGAVPAGAEFWGPLARERRSAVRAYAALQRLPELLQRVKNIENRLDERAADSKVDGES